MDTQVPREAPVRDGRPGRNPREDPRACGGAPSMLSRAQHPRFRPRGLRERVAALTGRGVAKPVTRRYRLRVRPPAGKRAAGDATHHRRAARGGVAIGGQMGVRTNESG
eukprot:4124768-Pyramimonas_sp.AAC.1